jgi:hypothetical protein
LGGLRRPPGLSGRAATGRRRVPTLWGRLRRPLRLCDWRQGSGLWRRPWGSGMLDGRLERGLLRRLWGGGLWGGRSVGIELGRWGRKRRRGLLRRKNRRPLGRRWRGPL